MMAIGNNEKTALADARAIRPDQFRITKPTESWQVKITDPANNPKIP